MISPVFGGGGERGISNEVPTAESLSFKENTFFRSLIFWGPVGIWKSGSGSVAKVVAEGDSNESEYDWCLR